MYNISFTPITIRDAPATTGNRRERKIQPIRNKEKVKKTDSDWSESKEDKLGGHRGH
jgi:hypothetical protein